jgi:uncharacterized protein YidB (DUF937 family)
MGLLDGILKSVLGGGGGASGGAANGQQDQLMAIVASLLKGQGGLGGLVSNFSKAGLGDVVKSWISTGQNAPVSASQLTQVLGSGQIDQIAKQLGVNSGQAGDLLSKFLPQVVDHLTPNGQVTADHSGDLLNAALGALKGKFFG